MVNIIPKVVRAVYVSIPVYIVVVVCRVAVVVVVITSVVVATVVICSTAMRIHRNRQKQTQDKHNQKILNPFFQEKSLHSRMILSDGDRERKRDKRKGDGKVVNVIGRRRLRSRSSWAD